MPGKPIAPPWPFSPFSPGKPSGPVRLKRKWKRDLSSINYSSNTNNWVFWSSDYSFAQFTQIHSKRKSISAYYNVWELINLLNLLFFNRFTLLTLEYLNHLFDQLVHALRFLLENHLILSDLVVHDNLWKWEHDVIYCEISNFCSKNLFNLNALEYGSVHRKMNKITHSNGWKIWK